MRMSRLRGEGKGRVTHHAFAVTGGVAGIAQVEQLRSPMMMGGRDQQAVHRRPAAAHCRPAGLYENRRAPAAGMVVALRANVRARARPRWSLPGASGEYADY